MLVRRRITDFRSLRFRVYFRFGFRAFRIPFRFLFCNALPLVAGGQRDEIGGFDGRGAEELDLPRHFSPTGTSFCALLNHVLCSPAVLPFRRQQLFVAWAAVLIFGTNKALFADLFSA